MPLKVAGAGLRNGVLNFGAIKAGKISKRALSLSNANKTHTTLTFQAGNAQGDPLIVDPAGNFGFPTGAKRSNCPQALPANKKCTLNIWFMPQDNLSNPKTATLIIFDNANNGPQSITLSGTAK